MRAPRLVLLGMVLALSGCVYPAYRTLQPSGEVRFVDEAGQKVTGVNFYIIAKNYPGGDNEWYTVWPSNNSDRITINGFHEWQLEILMLHGRAEYKWIFCTEKSGYADYVRSSWDRAELPDNVIVMKKGTMQPCVDNLDPNK